MSRSENQSRIAMHASLVVLLIDDFTGKPITGSAARARIPNEKPPVLKPDGYRVFLNLTAPSVDVCCESGIYNPKVVNITLDGTDEMKLVRIRLVPNRAYPIPSDTTVVTGNGTPGQRVRLRSTDADSSFRLLYDYSHTGEGADRICLYNPQNRELGGKSFFIQGKNKGRSEYVTLTDCVEDGCWRLDHPLSSDYKKIGTMLFPVHEAVTDADGYFYLPIAGVTDSGAVFCVQTDSDDEAREVVLTAGKVNKIEI